MDSAIRAADLLYYITYTAEESILYMPNKRGEKEGGGRRRRRRKRKEIDKWIDRWALPSAPGGVCVDLVNNWSTRHYILKKNDALYNPAVTRNRDISRIYPFFLL